MTPAGHASAWTILSNELPRVHQALARSRVEIATLSTIVDFDRRTATLADIFTGAVRTLPCRSLVIVGLRRPEDRLYRALMDRRPGWPEAGIKSVTRIGDALAPGAIVHAVHSGHLYARELDETPTLLPYRLDVPISLG